MTNYTAKLMNRLYMVSKLGNGRILFVVGSLMVGGTEIQLALLAEQLKIRGWSVDVFPLEKSGALVERLERVGIHVCNGEYASTRRTRIGALFSLVVCEARLVWRLLQSRPDIVHGFLPLTNFMSAVAGRMAFVRSVITSKRALGRHQDRHPGWRWLDRAANVLSDVVTANSRAVASDTEERDGYETSKIIVIPNGLNFTQFDDLQQDRNETRCELGLSMKDIAIVMVANLIPYKGHRELVEAFSRVAASDPRAKLCLIGQDRGVARDLMSDADRLGV